MEELFIKEITINEVRSIRDFHIPFSETERKHLIITGKNGSGKTSVLEEMKRFLGKIRPEIVSDILEVKRNLKEIEMQLKKSLHLNEAHKNRLQKMRRELMLWTGIGVWIDFNIDIFGIEQKIMRGGFVLTYFPAKRNIKPNIPKGIQKIELKSFYELEEFASVDFVQHIVNLRVELLFAQQEGDKETESALTSWFANFEQQLRALFGNPHLQLQFDRKNYNFNLIEEGKEPYNLQQLSDGYSAILSIVTELMMRMESRSARLYDVQGVVLIDELETHLHVDLQKRILPFLTAFFPKIQFIVTTHSPFVINSVANAVVCDLEKRIVTEDLSDYSYGTLIESYFDSDTYSEGLKQKVAQLEVLTNKIDRTPEEETQRRELDAYLTALPKYESDELEVKLQQIRLNYLAQKRPKR